MNELFEEVTLSLKEKLELQCLRERGWEIKLWGSGYFPAERIVCMKILKWGGERWSVPEAGIQEKEGHETNVGTESICPRLPSALPQLLSTQFIQDTLQPYFLVPKEYNYLGPISKLSSCRKPSGIASSGITWVSSLNLFESLFVFICLILTCGLFTCLCIYEGSQVPSSPPCLVHSKYRKNSWI